MTSNEMSTSVIGRGVPEVKAASILIRGNKGEIDPRRQTEDTTAGELNAKVSRFVEKVVVLLTAALEPGGGSLQDSGGDPGLPPILVNDFFGGTSRLASVLRHLLIKLPGGNRALRRHDLPHHLRRDEGLNRFRLLAHASLEYGRSGLLKRCNRE